MTRIGRLLQPVNWKYALGELTLIVVGVVIALAISNWNERRHDRVAEERMLHEFSVALALDIRDFDDALELLQRHDSALTHVIDRLPGRLTLADSIQLGGAYWAAGHPLQRTAPYESLKSGRITLSNDTLWFRIVNLYEGRYASVELARENARQTVLEVLRPYFLTHFTRLRAGRSAVPIDLEFVSNDHYFANILSYRRSVVRGNLIEGYTEARDEAVQLRVAIEAEIRKD